jgi:hypothetical protein
VPRRRPRLRARRRCHPRQVRSLFRGLREYRPCRAPRVGGCQRAGRTRNRCGGSQQSVPVAANCPRHVDIVEAPPKCVVHESSRLSSVLRSWAVAGSSNSLNEGSGRSVWWSHRSDQRPRDQHELGGKRHRTALRAQPRNNSWATEPRALGSACQSTTARPPRGRRRAPVGPEADAAPRESQQVARTLPGIGDLLTARFVRLCAYVIICPTRYPGDDTSRCHMTAARTPPRFRCTATTSESDTRSAVARNVGAAVAERPTRANRRRCLLTLTGRVTGS